MVLHLLVVAAVANAEEEAAVGQVVERRHLLCQPERIALGDQGDAGAEAKLLVTAAHAVRARNWSWVRQYSSGRGGAPALPPQGVRRDTGMWLCSGNHSESKP